MLTFQNLYETYQTITKDSTTANVTLGKLLINDTHKNVCGLADFTFLDDEWYGVSVASQGAYRLPHNFTPNSIISVYIENGDIKYFPTEVMSMKEFDSLSAVSSTASSPQYYCIFNNYINFYPLPSGTDWDIYLKYRQMPKEMTAANYTTGTMTATNNSRNLVGIGTTFTASMVGRYILLPDGLWYEIQSFSTTELLLLSKTYEGTTATSTYIIGECPIIPDGFQEILLYKPLEHYFMSKGEEKRSAFYKQLYDNSLAFLRSRFLSRSSNVVFKGGKTKVINPNDYPLNLS
jgi:hypothetical protein